MGVLHINSDNSTRFADAMVYRNSNERQFRDWSQSGVAAPNVAGLNDTWDKVQQPFATTGDLIDSTGSYLFHDGADGESLGSANAVEAVRFENVGVTHLYVGVNIATSGVWSAGVGMVLPPTSGVTLGGPDFGGQRIRNAWAITSGNFETGKVAVYTANQRTGV